MAPKRHCLHVALLVHALCLLNAAAGAAQEPTAGARIDGISIIIAASSTEASSVTPILTSDVELIRYLLLLDRYGANWRDHADRNVEVERRRARRFAVLVRLLASGMIGSNEEPDHAYRNEVVLQLKQRSGGPRAFRRMLAQCGVDETDLRNWISQMMIARRQLRQIYERAGVSVTGAETEPSAAENDRRMKDAVADWLGTISGRREIQFVDADAK